MNLAARLEAAVSQCGTQNLFCSRTFDLTRDKDDIIWRRFGRLQVSGKTEALDIYEAFSTSQILDREWIDLYHKALEIYERGAFEDALAAFELVNKTRDGGDPPSLHFSQLCQQLIAEGKPEDWQPIFKTSK